MPPASEYTDLGAFLLARLRASDAVKALVVGGAARILDAGELTGEILARAEEDRRQSKSAQVLALVVLDTGESGQEGVKIATASVFAYDRQRGYVNIRAAREAVIGVVVNHPVSLVRGGFIVQTTYAGRSGLVQFEDFDLDYERADFSGLLTYADSGDIYA